MRKLLTLCFLGLLSFQRSSAQTLIPVGDELLLPQYAYYGGTSAAHRVPFVCRLKLTGLTANATYRYMSGMSSTNNLNTTQSPGNMYRINNGLNASYGYIVGMAVTKAINSSEINFDSMIVDTRSRHGRFTADAGGTYTGWFACVPTGNATQQANGSDVYFYVHLNDGGSGTTLVRSFRTTSTVKLLNYTNDATGITPIIGTSSVGDEKFVTLYDNTASSGRPLYCTFTENNNNSAASPPGNLNESTLWTNPNIYGSVDGVSGKWVGVIPNNLPTGVRAINMLNIDGTVLNTTPSSDDDGVWFTTSTVNPRGDSTAPILMNFILLPIQLSGFSATPNKDGVLLEWSTSQESNNRYFELSRANSDLAFKPITQVAGALNSTEKRTYTFFDKDAVPGNNYYRLKQVDVDGREKVFNVLLVKFRSAKNNLSIMASNDNEVVVSLQVAEAQAGTISYVSFDGKVLYSKAVSVNSGVANIRIPVSKASSRAGIITYTTGNDRLSIRSIRP